MFLCIFFFPRIHQYWRNQIPHEISDLLSSTPNLYKRSKVIVPDSHKNNFQKRCDHAYILKHCYLVKVYISETTETGILQFNYNFVNSTHNRAIVSIYIAVFLLVSHSTG